VGDGERVAADGAGGAGGGGAGGERVEQERTRERLIVFSDAVLAIAMTLLALDLPVPSGQTEPEVWHSFVRLLPENYLSFMISFLVTARFWYTHHRFFLFVDRADGRLTQLNLACLLMIMLIPFATRVLTVDGAFRISTILYAIVIASIALIFLVMVRHVVRRPLLRPGVAPAAIRPMAVGVGTAAVVFLISIPVTFISATAAEYSWLIMFAVARLLVPLIDRHLT
jgi:uncharacterized membrane protein